MKNQLIALPMIFLAACGPDLSPEQQAVHTITDTTGCTYIDTDVFTGQPGTVHDYIKREVFDNGGNAYKILTSNPDSAWVANDVERISYEVWRCN